MENVEFKMSRVCEGARRRCELRRFHRRQPGVHRIGGGVGEGVEARREGEEHEAYVREDAIGTRMRGECVGLVKTGFRRLLRVVGRGGELLGERKPVFTRRRYEGA